MYNFKRTLTKRLKSAVDMFNFKQIDEENVEENDLFYNIIIYQLRRNDARKTYNNE